jgi:hypothetical protein
MKVLMIASAAAVSTLVVASTAVAASTSVTVSGPSPFASCSNAHQTGKNYLNAEVEPSVTAVTSSKLVGAFQQDRWSNGGAHGLVAASSFDGGASWSETALPFSGCAAGAVLDPFTGTPYDRASDPWVSAGPDGTVYAVSLSATETDGSIPGNNDTAVAAATSTNGGVNWHNAQLIKADQGTTPIFEVTHFFNDKESVTADPLHAGTAYVVWDRLAAPSAQVDAILRSHAGRGPTWFSKTTDGGKTWSTARPIFDPGERSQTIGNIVVVDSTTGNLYDFFERFQATGSPNAAPRGASLGFVKSMDGGATWSDATTVAAQVLSPNDVDPNRPGASGLLRTGEGLPAVAVDPSSGQLYTVWEDARFTSGAVSQVVISTSIDGGASWSSPALVSTTTPANRAAFTPEVAVNSAGAVSVTYYDLRNLDNTNTSTLPTIMLAKTSTNHGASFGPDIDLAGPFNDLVAPFAGGFMLGDYSALVSTGTGFHSFFVQTNCTDSSCTANPTDVFAISY